MAKGTHIITSYGELVDTAVAYHNAQLERAQSEFRIGAYERFDFDQTSGLLTFSDGGVPKVHSRAQIIGSHSTVSNTWLWSWHNPSVLPELTVLAAQVRVYGEANGHPKLTEPKFAASEDESWRLAAVAAYIVKAACIYRCPVRIGSSFLAIESLSWAT